MVGGGHSSYFQVWYMAIKPSVSTPTVSLPCQSVWNQPKPVCQSYCLGIAKTTLFTYLSNFFLFLTCLFNQVPCDSKPTPNELKMSPTNSFSLPFHDVFHCFSPPFLCFCLPNAPLLFPYSLIPSCSLYRCEQLLGVNGNLRQELMLVKRDHGSGEHIHKLEESLSRLMQTLIQRYIQIHSA